MLRKILVSAAALIIVAVIIAFAIGPAYLEKGFNRVIDHEAYDISDEARAMMLATLIQPLASSSATKQYSKTPSPIPP